MAEEEAARENAGRSQKARNDKKATTRGEGEQGAGEEGGGRGASSRTKCEPKEGQQKAIGSALQQNHRGGDRERKRVRQSRRCGRL